MSVRPLLVFRGFDGEVAVMPLQIDLSRREAEDEAAYLIHTDELAGKFADISATVTVLLVDEDGRDTAIDALFAGLAVHSLDCDCQDEDASPYTVDDMLADAEAFLSTVTGEECGHEGHEGRDCGV